MDLGEAPWFHDEEEARRYTESVRWQRGPACPHCRTRRAPTRLERRDDTETGARPGVYQCNQCRRQFTVTVGTFLHRSHIPLHKWLGALQLIRVSDSRKEVTPTDVARILGLGYKTAWLIFGLLKKPERKTNRGRPPTPRLEVELKKLLSDKRKLHPTPKQGGGSGAVGPGSVLAEEAPKPGREARCEAESFIGDVRDERANGDQKGRKNGVELHD